MGFATVFAHRKPSLEVAREYVKAELSLNAGMFAFTIASLQKALKLFAPEIAAVMDKNYDDALASFATLPSISIDYAVMEKAGNVAIVPMDLTWSDMGSWDSYAESQKGDADGNVFRGNVAALGTHNTVVVGSKRLVTVLDVEDLIVVDTDDAVLITRRGASQNVKALQDELERQGHPEAVEHLEIIRPWGRYRVLDARENRQDKEHHRQYREQAFAAAAPPSTDIVFIRGSAEVTVGR